MRAKSEFETRKGLKYTATRMDIVNDFYDECQRLFLKYRYNRDAVLAIDEIESLATWWANSPAVVVPERAWRNSATMADCMSDPNTTDQCPDQSAS